jgi:oxalate decarboxylase
VFDNGYFSEFGTFSITDWLGHTPAETLAKNFDFPASTFANFPKKEVYIAEGPVPPPLSAEPAQGSLNAPPLTHRYQLLAQAPDLYAGGTMRIVSMREFPISMTMTGALLTIKPGSLRELHWHPNAAEWQYYLKGNARMTTFGSHGRARTDDRLHRGRCRLCAARLRPLHREHWERRRRDCHRLQQRDLRIDLDHGMDGGHPGLLLATNFGAPESVLAKFPKGAVVPPEQS